MWRRELRVVVVVERVVPHLHVVDKNQEGHPGSECSQPQARPHSPGFQHWKDKGPITSGYKNHWGIREAEETASSSG